jgi:hypothetical protein
VTRFGYKLMSEEHAPATSCVTCPILRYHPAIIAQAAATPRAAAGRLRLVT